jgi:hypothetical protein
VLGDALHQDAVVPLVVDRAAAGGAGHGGEIVVADLRGGGLDLGCGRELGGGAEGERDVEGGSRGARRERDREGQRRPEEAAGDAVAEGGPSGRVIAVVHRHPLLIA